jgi:histone acetyltransferase 1
MMMGQSERASTRRTLIRSSTPRRPSAGTLSTPLSLSLSRCHGCVGWSRYVGLKIELDYNASTLAVRSRVGYSERCEPADDLESPLAQLLGTGRADSAEEFAAPALAVGEVVHEYTRQGSGAVSFEVRRATFADASAKELNSRITSLLLLFVDGASSIDESDHKWLIFTCYERRTLGPPRVVGYTTVYPFSVVLPGGIGLVERFRLSQILVLPPYQRGGHGAELLNCVYREARARGSHEVAIEDPGPDMMRCQLSTNVHNAASAGLLVDPSSFLWERKQKFVTAGRETLLLAAPAATALFELCMLALLDQTDEEALRGFRLAVKARLFKEDEQLLEFEVDARKAELAVRYEECFERYSVVLATRRTRAVLESTLLCQRTVDSAIGSSVDPPSTAGCTSSSTSVGGGDGDDSHGSTLQTLGCVGIVTGERRPQESEKENDNDSDGPGAQLQTHRSKRTRVSDQGNIGSGPAWCAQGNQHDAFTSDGSSDVQAKE